VARAEGVELEVDFVAMIAEVFGSSTNVASMLQDLRNGKPTEIEYMNGAIAALGVARGIPCPVNRALAEIIKAMERSRSAVRSG
jgi:2-dehydropantoate 2-reductase